MAYIKGIFKKAIYKNDSGYTVGILKIIETSEDIKNTITFTGYFCDLFEDDTIKLEGNIVTHEKYGLQFETVKYEKIMPESIDGITEFLASDLFKGIGEKLAKKITETLGKDALNKILEDKRCLYSVDKITDKKINTIYETLTKYNDSHKTIVYLTNIGFTTNDALAIYNFYKENTIKKIEENVFNIISDTRINFLKIDTVAKNLGMDFLDKRRIKAVIMYIMGKLLFESGDTFLEFDNIFKSTVKFLNYGLSEETFDEYLTLLINEKQVYNDNNKYYLYDVYEAQKNIINKLKILANIEDKKASINKHIKEIEQNLEIKYNELQIEAIKKSLEKNLLIITGGPGTGKTTIIKTIILLYKTIYDISERNLTNEIALLAPTGKASKRMSEKAIFPASTIHRYLKWNKDSNTFNVNEYNKNNHKLIIIDEVSMIDINLFDSLLKGLNDNIKLILVGDYNQLPSVGPGQILKDVIDSQKIETVNLEMLYRQSKSSYINILANDIKNNTLTEEFLIKHSDYNFLDCPKFNLYNTIKDLAKKLKVKNMDIQFMAPMYKGECGIDNLNILLQDIFNPKDKSKNEYKYGEVIYRVGDKILQLENMPDDNVFNGDVGFIEDIYTLDKETVVDIDFDGDLVHYKVKDLYKIKHGFVISIHKSQGSEFDNVVIIISSAFKRMLYKKLLYTAITRAKKKLFIIGEKEAFIYGINNDNEKSRNTDLKNKLISNIKS